MSVNIKTFQGGDTDYIATLNNNFAAMKSAVEALQAANTGSSNSQVSFGTFLDALFGTDPVLIGKNSYSETHTTTVVTVQPGYIWKQSASAILQATGVATLDFTGRAAGTYYIEPDNGGNAVIVSTSTDAIYTVVWSGTAISSVTKVAKFLFTAQEETNALTSTHFSATYAELNLRLNAIEAAL